MLATVTIELKGVRFFAHHGWHEEEAILGNAFEITFLGAFGVIDKLSSIADTVDYSQVYEVVRSTFAEREKLLETVAQKISDRIKAAFPKIQSIQLTITKLNPMIPAFTGTVGITYVKSFR
jgi:dihydroneopterin aldolase